MKLSTIVTHLCDGESGLLITVITSDVSETINNSGLDIVEIKIAQQEITTSCGNRIVFLSDRSHLERGWLFGGQPNGIILFDAKFANAQDKVFAMSRVREPKGLFKQYTLVNAYSSPVGLQNMVSYLSHGWVNFEVE